VLVDVPKDIQQQLDMPDWDTPMAISGYMSRWGCAVLCCVSGGCSLGCPSAAARGVARGLRGHCD